MDTKPLDKIAHLELENASLKLQLLQRNAQDAQRNFQDAKTAFQNLAAKTLKAAQLSPEEWGINLDDGTFVKRALTAAQ